MRNVKGKVYSRKPAEEMEEINLKWAEYYEGTVIYGDELVYDSYTNEQGETGFSLAPFQNLDALNENTTVSMDCIYQGQKVLNISQYAFLGCNAKNIIITCPKDYTERFEVNFESGVFMQCLAENIIIDVNITTKDPASAQSDNSSTAIFYNCSAKSIELPDTLDKIPYQTFIDCYNLEKIKFGTNEDNHLSPKIKRIESQGFYGCIGLPSLYIPETIEFIGQAAFHSWDLPQSVEIDLHKAGDNWNPNWKEGVKNADVIYFQTEKELDITFVVNQEGVIDASGGITITVNRDSTLNNSSLPQPTSVSHNFSGKWYLDEKRTQEYKLDTIIKSNLTLYAGWEIKEYTIILNENKYLTFYDTTGAEVNEITLKHGQQMQFYVTIKDGYKNVEIKLDNEKLIANTGGIYTIVATKNAEVTCVAALEEYTITYTNLRGGTNPNTITTYTVESETINFANPVWDAYNSSTWDFPSIPQGSTGNKIISAIWSNPKVYSITYANLRGGTNPNTVTSYTIESNTINFAAPEWNAYDNATWNITSIPKGSWGNKTIEAIWTNPVEFTITYTNLREGINPNTIATYTVESETINFANPVWDAYNSSIWDIPSIPQGSTGNKIITALWSNPKEYSITYTNLRGGTNPNTVTSYTIESNTINLKKPEWDAYNGRTWNITSIPTGSWGDKTITAIWSDPEEYTITFLLDDDPNATNPNGQTMTYTVEDRVALRKATSPGYEDSEWVFEETDIQISGWTPDTYFENMKLKVKWGIQKRYHITFDYSGGQGSKSELWVDYGSNLESFAIPIKKDYRFIGFYSDNTGARYYNSLMYGEKWYQPDNDTLIADWEQEYFYITFEQQNGIGTGSIFTEPMRVKYGSSWQSIEMPTRKGYEISGFYYKWKMDNRKIYNADGTYNRNNVEFGSTYDIRSNITLFCYWEIKDYYYFNIDIINVRSLNATSLDKPALAIDQSYYNASAPETLEWVEYGSNGQIISRDERGFSGWRIKINSLSSNWIDYSTNRILSFNVEEFIDNIILKNFPDYDPVDTIYIRAIYGESLNGGDSGCVAEGTYITLADGSKKLVEELTGNEMLLVWNLYTGKLDTAPILFIDWDSPKMYEVIQLHFSDGTSVRVISEHGFWDLTLNQYVYLDSTASKYIGHWFNKQAMNEDGNFVQTEVQLIDVVVEQEYSSAWSPVTYGNLCYYVNDMLSMPGGIKGLFNIFEVDSEFMKYDEAAMLSDIETYGLFTYEEFSELVSVPEEIFDAVCGQYLKVAIGKGMITIEEIQQLVNRYSNFF